MGSNGKQRFIRKEIKGAHRTLGNSGGKRD